MVQLVEGVDTRHCCSRGMGAGGSDIPEEGFEGGGAGRGVLVTIPGNFSVCKCIDELVWTI